MKTVARFSKPRIELEVRFTKESKSMFATLGTTELLIVLVIVLLLFGIGRIGKIGHELGAGIRAFKQGLQSPKSDVREQVE